MRLGEGLGEPLASAMEALERHRESPAAERAAAGDKWEGSLGLVFTTRIGTPIRQAKLHLESWKPLLRRAGLPDTRFHDLKHTCATLLLTKGFTQRSSPRCSDIQACPSHWTSTVTGTGAR